MAYYSGFQSNAYQNNAFQILAVGGIPPVVDTTTGRGGESYTYVTPYQKLRAEQYEQRLAKDKSDLERLESVLAETERKQKVAAQSRAVTKSLQRQLELEVLEAEYLNEMNRLLMVRAALMERIRKTKQLIMMMIVMKKRRLRVLN